jgi:neogenin
MRNFFDVNFVAPEPLTPMMPPIGVKAAVLSATSVLLTWTDTSLGRNQVNSDNNRYYIVRYNPKLARKPRLVNTTQLNVHLDDLRPDTEYEFSIKVIKGQRQSTWSLSVFNQTGQAGKISTVHSFPVGVH